MTDHIPQASRTVTVGLLKMTLSGVVMERLLARGGGTGIFGIMGSASMDATEVVAPAGTLLIPLTH